MDVEDSSNIQYLLADSPPPRQFLPSRITPPPTKVPHCKGVEENDGADLRAHHMRGLKTHGTANRPAYHDARDKNVRGGLLFPLSWPRQLWLPQTLREGRNPRRHGVRSVPRRLLLAQQAVPAPPLPPTRCPTGWRSRLLLLLLVFLKPNMKTVTYRWAAARNSPTNHEPPKPADFG